MLRPDVGHNARCSERIPLLEAGVELPLTGSIWRLKGAFGHLRVRHAVVCALLGVVTGMPCMGVPRGESCGVVTKKPVSSTKLVPRGVLSTEWGQSFIIGVRMLLTEMLLERVLQRPELHRPGASGVLAARNIELTGVASGIDDVPKSMTPKASAGS